MTKDREKEIYELWWNFLKESTGYKEYCDSSYENRKIDIQIYEQYHRMYSMWGDVHRSTFESWWAQNSKKFKKKYVTELSESIEKEIDDVVESIMFDKWMKKQKSIDCTIAEFKEIFIKTIKSRKFCLYLKINIQSGESKTDTKKKILSEISRILIKYYENNRGENSYLSRFQFLRHSWPTEMECDRLKNNLKLYVSAKEKGYLDNSGRFGYRKRKEMISNNERNPDSRGVQLTRQIDEVRYVIRCVEHGYFPWMERKGKNKGPRGEAT